MIAFVVGLKAEARLLKGASVFIGGGDAAGAEIAAKRAIDAGATGLISFGLAGGLAGHMAAGSLLIPRRVAWRGTTYQTDPGLSAALGGCNCDLLTAEEQIVVTASEKAGLCARTGADAVDLESGATAEAASRAGVPFAVLRAVCDPAGRDLPPAALAALDQAGAIGLGRVLISLARHPLQLAGLLRLAQDAALARASLTAHLRDTAGLRAMAKTAQIDADPKSRR